MFPPPDAITMALAVTPLMPSFMRTMIQDSADSFASIGGKITGNEPKSVDDDTRSRAHERLNFWTPEALVGKSPTRSNS